MSMNEACREETGRSLLYYLKEDQGFLQYIPSNGGAEAGDLTRKAFAIVTLRH